MVRNRLSSAQGQLRNGDYARQKSRQDSRPEDLIAAVESAPEGDAAAHQRRLEQYRLEMAEWDREQGGVWKSLETEISALEAEQEQLERHLADYVGVRVEAAYRK